MAFTSQPLAEYNAFVTLDIWAFRTKALVCVIENGLVRIIGAASTRQSKRHVIRGEIADLAWVAETAKRTILKAAEWLDSLPSDIILSIHSSSLIYDAIGMNYVRQDPDTPIDMEELDRMIASTETKSLERIKPKSENRLDLAPAELRLITTSLTSIALDGKKVSNPIWFTARNVKLNLINFFVPSSISSALTLVARDLGMKVVSLVPVPVALPKIIEDSIEGFDANVFVDFGYSKTTVILENKSEILWAHVIDFGYDILENALSKDFPNHRSIDIEDCILHPAKADGRQKAVFERFHSLLFDAVRVAIDDIAKGIDFHNFVISWGGATKGIEEYFTRESAHTPHLPKHVSLLLPESVKVPDGSYATAYALAVSAKELLSIRKDPIARILRYVIYRHE